MERVALRRAAQLRGIPRPAITCHTIVRAPHQHARSLSVVPRIAEVSFWKSMVPKPLRRENKITGSNKSWMSKEWNPATFFIIIFLLIGSMSIQMISLRKNFDAFMRRSDVRIGLLREVVEKLRNGEEVDVEKVLGSGDAEREAAWEDVLKEIENNSPRKNQGKQERSKAPEATSPIEEIVTTPEPKVIPEPAEEPVKGRTAYFF